jgi:hypothetical protein
MQFTKAVWCISHLYVQHSTFCLQQPVHGGEVLGTEWMVVRGPSKSLCLATA